MAVDLSGRVAIVTGGAGGIGRAVASALVARGAAVVINDLGTRLDGEGTNASMARTVVNDLKTAGGRAAANMDLIHTMDGAAALVQHAIDTFGGVDILVHAAGNTAQVPVHELDELLWDRTMDVHVKALFTLMSAAAEPLRAKKRGRVITFTSHVGLFVNRDDAQAYCAAKAAVAALSKSYAQALHSEGITVNSIAPSASTRMADTIPTEVLRIRAKQRNIELPTGLSDEQLRLTFIGDPKAIANLVAYLSSDQASEVTGQIFVVHNGHLAVCAPTTEAGSMDKPVLWEIDELVDSLPRQLGPRFWSNESPM